MLNGIDPNSLSNPDIAGLTREDLEQLCALSNSITILPCSVLGSFLAQEVVKGISSSGRPLSNVFIFESESLEVRSYPIA